MDSDGTVVQTGGTTYTLSDITADHTITVTFFEPPTITPSAGTYGTIAPSSPTVVLYNSNLTLAATPVAGGAVNQWFVDGSLVQTGGTTYTLNSITTNHTVSVTFFNMPVTVTPSAGANGSISPSTAQTVNSGGSLTFTATPNTNYLVSQWLLDGTSVQTGGTSYTLTNITANHTLQVTFKSTTVTGIGIAVGYSGSSLSTGSALLAQTTNGSQNWSVISTSPPGSTNYFSTGSCTGSGSDAICIAAGTYYNFPLYYPLLQATTDSGNSWSTISTTSLSNVSAANFNQSSCSGNGNINTTICIAAGVIGTSPVVYVSTNGTNSMVKANDCKCSFHRRFTFWRRKL